MFNRPEEHRCSGCRFKAKTRAGLNSHISQSPRCLEKVIAANQPLMDPSKRQRRESEPPAPGDNNYPDIQLSNDSNDVLYSSLLEGQPSSKRARVEDETDFPIKTNSVFDEFEPPAGTPQRRLPGVSNDFERLQTSQQTSGSKPWAPFSSIEDWDYAWWIMSSDLSQ